MDQNDQPVKIEDLNKTQLILLAILLSFITSVATGIVTVAVMQQAPASVTQPINRVVQQTIEKVVPSYISGKTQTVIVKEDDLIVDVVAKVRKGFAGLLATKDATEPIAEAYSIGNGSFIVPSAPIDANKTYTLQANKNFDAKVTGSSPLGFTVVAAIAAADGSLPNIPAATFAKDADIKSGQTAILVSKGTIQKGLVQSVKAMDDTLGTWNSILLDFKPTESSIGSILVNLDGQVIGLVVANTNGTISIVAPDAITAFLNSPIVPQVKSTSTTVPNTVTPVS